MTDKIACEGCGQKQSKNNAGGHRVRCARYREWSKGLPYQCPCGVGFPAERSLRSHKKGCPQAVLLEPGGRFCSCGERVVDAVRHRPLCKGPPNPESVVLTHSHPPDDDTCVCGKRHGPSGHRDYCPQWWVYRQSLPAKCEGCGVGFRDAYSKRAHAQACELWKEYRRAKDEEERSYPCPSCGELMRGYQLGLHVNACKGSFTRADWEEWRGRLGRERRAEAFARYAPEEEGAAFVTCRLCGQRFYQLAEHLVTAHNTTAEKYRAATGSCTQAMENAVRRKATLTERYGVDHPAKMPDHWEKTVAAFRERFGVDHPLHLSSFLRKRENTCIERFGFPHPTQSAGVQEKTKITCRGRFGADAYFGSDAYKAWSMKLYGSPHPMGNREYVLKLFEKLSSTRPNPNGLERAVQTLAPSLIYTGDWTWWRYLPLLKGHKNPDFLVPGPDPENPREGVTKVVEAFGDYWHSRIFTGKAPFDHEQELVEAYADIGIRCLIVWEGEVKTDPAGVAARLAAFLGEGA